MCSDQMTVAMIKMQQQQQQRRSLTVIFSQHHPVSLLLSHYHNWSEKRLELNKEDTIQHCFQSIYILG